MDPLTITASILALLSAGGKIAQGLKKIESIRHAPEVLVALNNEVSAIRLQIDAVRDVLSDVENNSNSPSHQSTRNTLENLELTLLELESFIAYRFTIVAKDGKTLRVDKSAWWRGAEQKAQYFKDVLRDQKNSLATTASLLAYETSRKSAKTSQMTYCSIQNLSDEVRRAHITYKESLQVLHYVSQQQRGQILPPETSDQQYQQVYKNSGQSRTSSFEPLKQLHASSPYASNARTKIQLIRVGCSQDCCCQCHSYNRFQSPSCLTSILGQLFVGYQAAPWITKPCSCQSKSSRMMCTFFFPSWLVRAAIVMALSVHSPKTPELVIRVMNVRADSTLIFSLLVSAPDKVVAAEVRSQLKSGETSVLDVTSRGRTLLHFALKNKLLDIVEVLIQSGADIYFEDSFGRSPLTIAWDYYWWSERRSTKFCEIMSRYFRDECNFDSFGFSRLHRVYLGITGISFDDVLSSALRSEIDASDAQGRTVLSWASLRGDVETVRKLLSYGADPNKASRDGKTPLLWSLQASDTQCLRVLLAGKADVRAVDKFGSSALHCAAFSMFDRVEILDLLLSQGLDIEGRDFNYCTPLHIAACWDNVVIARGLLSHGANINAWNDTEYTPLHYAAKFNSHQVLKLLISRSDTEFRAINEYCRDVVHYIAAFADLETLEIIATDWPCSLNMTRKDIDGYTAWGFAAWRRDNNREWCRTFSEPPDEDPKAWYRAFKDIVCTILERNGDIGEESKVDTMSDEESKAQSTAGQTVASKEENKTASLENAAKNIPSMAEDMIGSLCVILIIGVVAMLI